ncbi:hypothetical protein [Acidithiobacillus sp.]
MVQHVLPFVLMLTGGGRALEDLRMIYADRALRRLLHLDHLPSTGAAGAGCVVPEKGQVGWGWTG